MTNIILITLLFLAGCALYRWRVRIIGALRRFDARNAARREEEFRSRFDPHAHYRQTLRAAAEQVEDVTEIREPDPRTGVLLPRYVFLGVHYATRPEAEKAREDAILERAREFYIELDGRRLDRQPGNQPASPALPAPDREPR